MSSVSQREARAHRELILLFEHHRVKTAQSIDHVIDAGLFSEETWRLFGLGERQLVLAGTIGGAAAGALFDLATAGHSIGIPTFIGATGGAVGSFLYGQAATRAEGYVARWISVLRQVSRCIWAGGDHIRRPLSGSKLSLDSARPRVGCFLLPD